MGLLRLGVQLFTSNQLGVEQGGVEWHPQRPQGTLKTDPFRLVNSAARSSQRIGIGVGFEYKCMAAECSCQLFERYTEKNQKEVGPRHHVISDNKLFEIL